MTAYSPIYRSLARVTLTKDAWLGNRVKGDEPAYLADGHTLFVVERCDPERVKRRLRRSPKGHPPPDQPEGSLPPYLRRIEAQPREEWGEPDRWGRMARSLGGYPVVGFGDAFFNARKLRLAAYVTRADRMTVSVGAFAHEDGDWPLAIFWRAEKIAALVMGLFDDEHVEYRYDPEPDEEAGVTA